uniref:Uncharacterized protein n=1 Tax=Tetradesmus obliquus TaxID=3088 RepID=A0A383V9L1_TETOB|eukprot:jgi/Sobl393_1/19970/SZX62258.1
MGYSTGQSLPVAPCSSIFRAIRLLQVICCLAAAVSADRLKGGPGWTYVPGVALLLAALYSLSWKVLSARGSKKSPASYEFSTKARFCVLMDPCETGRATLAFALDAVLCLSFTVAAALLLTNTMVHRQPTILGSMTCHASVCAHSGSPNTYIVRGPPSSISMAWTMLFMMLVVNGLLFNFSTIVLAVWSMSWPSSGSTMHTLIATGTPHSVSTLVATV